jgi:hypothetical protein
MKLPKTEPAITGPRSLRDPRSREYAIQTMRSLKRFLESKTFDAKHVEEELQLIIEHKHWNVCGFKSLDAYLQAEIGVSHKQLKSRLAQDLAADPTVTALAEYGVNQHTGGGAINTSSQRGSTNAAYLVRRLKRDHPEIAQALALGEYKSARAAAKAAGIVKELTPLQQIQKLWAKLTEPERKEHLEWTLKQCATCGREGHWIMKDGSDYPQGSWCDACCDEKLNDHYSR